MNRQSAVFIDKMHITKALKDFNCGIIKEDSLIERIAIDLGIAKDKKKIDALKDHLHLCIEDDAIETSYEEILDNVFGKITRASKIAFNVFAKVLRASDIMDKLENVDLNKYFEKLFEHVKIEIDSVEYGVDGQDNWDISKVEFNYHPIQIDVINICNLAGLEIDKQTIDQVGKQIEKMLNDSDIEFNVRFSDKSYELKDDDRDGEIYAEDNKQPSPFLFDYKSGYLHIDQATTTKELNANFNDYFKTTGPLGHNDNDDMD